jgi:hypothetical protein
MGIIRKGLHVASVGAVAPNSKKQRVAKQTLVAVQGGTPAQVRPAGGRYEHSLASLSSGSSRGRIISATSHTCGLRCMFNRQYHEQRHAEDVRASAEARAYRAANPTEQDKRNAAWRAAYDREHGKTS